MSSTTGARLPKSARKLWSIAIVIAMFSSFIGPMAASAADPVVITAAYGGFTPANIGSYQLNGDAVLNGSSLRLTQAEMSQSGSMFWKQKVALNNSGSFSTQFSFQIANPGGDGADGFTFCIQPGVNTAITDGGGLGYMGLPDSVAIEFDTYQNDDPNDNHIGIDLGGDIVSVATADAPFILQDGAVGYAWIEYDGVAQMLYVRVADSSTRPTDPLITYGVDLAAYYGESAFCGFTAATGGSYETHDILGWYFTNEYVSAGLDAATVTYVMGAASIEGVADPDAVAKSGTSDVTFTVKDADGVLMAGRVLAITAPDGGSVSDASVTTDANGEATVTFTAPNDDVFCAVKAAAVGGLQGEAIIAVGTAAPPYFTSVTETIRASVDADGNQGTDDYESYRGSRTPAISADGGHVAFYTGNVFSDGDTNYDRDWYVKDLETGAIDLVSADDDGFSGDYTGSQGSISNDDGSAAISATGRYIVFDSNSTTLDSGDTNDVTDVFMRDTFDDTTVRVSENGDGTNGTDNFSGEGSNHGSRSPVISRDGRYVAFYTGNAFVAEDTNNLQDWYRKDMTLGTFELVSVDSDENLVENVNSGEQGGGADRAAISADGQFIAFDSWATDLLGVDGDTNGYRDVFLRDMIEGTTVRVSEDADGSGDYSYGSRSPAISADGSYVAFISGNDYVEEDTNGSTTDWYLKDMTDGSIELVSKNMDGESGNDGMWDNDGQAAISDDNRYVAFVTQASDLTLDDTNGEPDVFVRDMQAGLTGVVSVSSAPENEYSNDWQQNCAMSADGRVVAYDSWSDNLVADDTNFGGEGGNCADVFVSYLEPNEDVVSTPLEGADRYETAIEISQDAFPSATTVVIATGENWPDALGGSALAGVSNGPVLLSRKATLPASVIAEIERLGATRAYVLGGTGALSSAAYNTLVGVLGAQNVTRLGGIDRYATANLVAAEVVDIQGSDYDGRAFVATGLEFADALSAAPIAAANGWPVYLSEMPDISDATVAAMQAAGVTDTILLGGKAAMPEGTSITILAAGFDAVRIEGVDRYETAAKVAAYGVSDCGLSWSNVAIATGERFPDALAGGPAQGLGGSVLLLSRTASLPTTVHDTLVAHSAAVSGVRFFGGTAALSQATRDAVLAALAE